MAKLIEGVWYYPFLVKYRTPDNKRRQMTLWAPARQYVADTIAHATRDGVIEVKPGSNVIISPKRAA